MRVLSGSCQDSARARNIGTFSGRGWYAAPRGRAAVPMRGTLPGHAPPLGANSTDVINPSPAVSEGGDMYFRERSTDNTRERGGIFPNFSKGVSRLGKGLQSGPVLGLYHFPVIPTSYPIHRLEQF